MPKTFNVTVSDQSFTIKAGDRLLDAALQSGVDLPHDCRSGQCGTCTVERVRGITLGGEAGSGSILACQARVFSNLEVQVPNAPKTVERNAVVEEIRDLAEGVVEVVIQPRQPIDWLPGQYMKLQFRGYPARCFSPTATLGGGAFDGKLRFHIKRVRGGLVTPRLGTEIVAGARLKLVGPLGHAFLRDHEAGRLVLAGSGTGFAPIWAIASAAHHASPEREILLVCGAKDAKSLYMGEALLTASRRKRTSVKIAFERNTPPIPGVGTGTPADFLGQLSSSDVVYAAGGPRMVERARDLAEDAGARFYADPFLPSPRSDPSSAFGLVSRVFSAAR
ncbi:2Fe-2S iron-sulfur cluster binding domain-containing protein [Maritimibacter sp. DP1N21-5]|uniref:2Fe-2S iron-sulfur cluster-binding protein n=1 Tax=Maritimibacter sp. DP1N21-5 TaxID=2836867 RepID=UPI001C4653EC|nr:2Fe-2S iron-sulfur cluster binding domain-containing protein [Maritimibacter sp. DP1N21-5]MBV7407799.1 2Fe-2S iron-sulfur cluster binding domain-containing protein [Maritimibacter sp. DP1N21-5]